MDRNLQSNYILTLGGSTRVYGDDSGEYNSHHRMSTDMSRIVMVDDTCTGSAKWERDTRTCDRYTHACSRA
jgi:hypothetical protein